MLGDICKKCGKRATPLRPFTEKRWHHCPRCGCTFNKDTQTVKEILAEVHTEGIDLAKKFKGK